jgi:hypothetical protein
MSGPIYPGLLPNTSNSERMRQGALSANAVKAWGKKPVTGVTGPRMQVLQTLGPKYLTPLKSKGSNQQYVIPNSGTIVPHGVPLSGEGGVPGRGQPLVSGAKRPRAINRNTTGKQLVFGGRSRKQKGRKGRKGRATRKN